MSGRRRTISKEETGVSPTSSEQSSLMSAVSSLPPHPWDAGLLNRRGPLEKLSRALIFPCVLLPLAIVRMVLMLCIAVFMFVSLLCFRGPAQSLLDPALNVCGRGLLFVFGVWPGCLRISGEPQLDKVPVAVVAPHLGMLDGFYFLYKGVPRPMALEPYAKIPLIGFLFRRIHGIAVPLPAAKKEKPGGGKPPAGADVPLSKKKTKREEILAPYAKQGLFCGLDSFSNPLRLIDDTVPSRAAGIEGRAIRAVAGGGCAASLDAERVADAELAGPK